MRGGKGCNSGFVTKKERTHLRQNLSIIRLEIAIAPRSLVRKCIPTIRCESRLSNDADSLWEEGKWGYSNAAGRAEVERTGTL